MLVPITLPEMVRLVFAAFAFIHVLTAHFQLSFSSKGDQFDIEFPKPEFFLNWQSFNICLLCLEWPQSSTFAHSCHLSLSLEWLGRHSSQRLVSLTIHYCQKENGCFPLLGHSALGTEHLIRLHLLLWDSALRMFSLSHEGLNCWKISHISEPNSVLLPVDIFEPL